MGCPSDEGDGIRPLLIVRPAAVQPHDNANGATVILQARGGDRLAVRTDNGTHALGSTSMRRQTSCLAVDAQTITLSEIEIFPTQNEALVYVDLRQTAGTADATIEDSCAGTTIKQLIVPVSGAANPPISDASAAEGGADAR
jgi:hypothetical protein